MIFIHVFHRTQSILYVEENPYPVYERILLTGDDPSMKRYLHWSQHMDTFVLSNNYWALYTADPDSDASLEIKYFSRDVDPVCPDEMKFRVQNKHFLLKLA